MPSESPHAQALSAPVSQAQFVPRVHEPPALEQVLAAREARWHQRLELAHAFVLPVLSCTLRMPHGLRMTASMEALCETLFATFVTSLAPAWSVAYRLFRVGADGPEGFAVLRPEGDVPAQPLPLTALRSAALRSSISTLLQTATCSQTALRLKSAAVDFESAHPLGGLVDVDVLDDDGSSVERQGLDLPPRACLVCGKPARVCVAGRAHTLDQVTDSVFALLNVYHGRSCARS